jgi:hypothetical protein
LFAPLDVISVLEDFKRFPGLDADFSTQALAEHGQAAVLMLVILADVAQECNRMESQFTLLW